VEEGRPDVVFVVWGRVHGRAEEIAAAVGGEGRSFWYPRLAGGPFRTLVRYALSAVATCAFLVRRRPRAVVATNPPVVPGVLAWAYSRVTGAVFVLDSHPSAFGRKGDAVSARLLPLHAWLARRAVATFVTTEEWVEQVDAWGGRGIVVHEAPAWRDPPASAPSTVAGSRPRVLFLGVFAQDEPVDAVVGAARHLPDVDVWITGDVGRAPEGSIAAAPANVRFVGFLDTPAYRRAVADADVVVSLTTEPTSVMRTAYEAVYAAKPLIVSDWPALRALFPYAVPVGNDAPSIAAGIRRAIEALPRLRDAAAAARDVQLDRWHAQLEAVRRAVSGSGGPPDPRSVAEMAGTTDGRVAR
jgi:hypothetical protein